MTMKIMTRSLSRRSWKLLLGQFVMEGDIDDDNDEDYINENVHNDEKDNSKVSLPTGSVFSYSCLPGHLMAGSSLIWWDRKTIVKPESRSVFWFLLGEKSISWWSSSERRGFSSVNSDGVNSLPPKVWQLHLEQHHPHLLPIHRATKVIVSRIDQKHHNLNLNIRTSCNFDDIDVDPLCGWQQDIRWCPSSMTTNLQTNKTNINQIINDSEEGNQWKKINQKRTSQPKITNQSHSEDWITKKPTKELNEKSINKPTKQTTLPLLINSYSWTQGQCWLGVDQWTHPDFWNWAYYSGWGERSKSF